MNDELFGEIKYDFGWVGKCSWPIFGNVVATSLAIPCAESAEIQDYQREAFSAFDKLKGSLCAAAEERIFEYYCEIMPELRLRFGPQFADQWAPKIGSLNEMRHLVCPTEVIVQQSFTNPPQRVVGLLFNCSWDTSLGLAVKFINEQLSEVGPQDIVL